MGLGDIYLSRKGYDKMINDLEILKTVRRREISKAIGLAREHGDISENADYDAAKDEQGMNEKRISELEDKLSRARILDDENIPHDEVLIGATVKLQDLVTDEEIAYTLVSEEEADFDANKISVTSPIGQGLLGHKENDSISITVPAGVLKYKVLKITRE